MKERICFYENIKKIMPFILSFLAVLGIKGLLNIMVLEPVTDNSFLYSIIFLMYIFIFLKIQTNSKKVNIFLVLFSAILSLILVWGSQLEFYGDIIWSCTTFIKIGTLIISLYPAVNFIYAFLSNVKSEKQFFVNSKKMFLYTFIVIFFFDILVFLALYPGVYGYDAGFQIMQMLEKGIEITANFSVLYSFLLAHLVKLGKVVFDSYEIGFAFYCLLQMLFLSYVATKIVLFCSNRFPKRSIYFMNVLFFSLFPLYTVMSVSAAQDSLFAGIFCLIIINITKSVEDDSYWQNKWNYISLGILVFLLCAIRNNGFYSIIFFIPFLFFSPKENRYKYLIVVTIPLVAFKIYSGPVFNLMGIQKGNAIREMLSVPSQQFARVYNYSHDSLSKKEIEELNKFYPLIQNFQYYNNRQCIADPAKAALDGEYTKENIADYVSLWTRVGVKNPEEYVEAFLLNSLGVWYPNKNYYDERMYHPYIEYDMLDAHKWNSKYISIKRYSKFHTYERILNYVVKENNWEKIPVISSMFTAGTYFLVFAYLFLLTIFKKNFKYILPLSIILGLYMTVFFAPVALFRYLFPIIMISPLMVNLIIYQKGDY